LPALLLLQTAAQAFYLLTVILLGRQQEMLRR